MRINITLASKCSTPERPASIQDVRNALTGRLRKEFGVQVKIFVDGNCLFLDRISVPAKLRGTGIGSKVMDKIIDYADIVKMDITLVCSEKGQMGTTSADDLIRFYKRFGFKHDSRYASKLYLIRKRSK